MKGVCSKCGVDLDSDLVKIFKITDEDLLCEDCAMGIVGKNNPLEE